MKKFLLSAFALAVAFSAAAFQMAPVQKAVTPKAFTGKTNFTPKHAPKLMKADSKISSLDDISGTYMMMYYSYFDDYARRYCEITITKTATDTYKISGWWYSGALDITATVDQSANTLTIARQQIDDNADYPSDLVNADDETFNEPLVGTIYADGIEFESWWGVLITSGSYEGYFQVAAAYTFAAEPMGNMTWTKSSTDYECNVFLMQSNDTVYVGNYGDLGYEAMVLLNEDRTFNVPVQWVDSMATYGNWYFVGLNSTGSAIVDLNGTGTPTVLTADSCWTMYSDETYWTGLNTPWTITRTDGGVFWEEEIPDVYILGEVGDQTWAPNAGVQMAYSEETGLYTAEIECKDADSNGYDYFSFTTQLAENADDWEAIAAARFGAVSEGDFLVTDELLGQELSLEAGGDAYKVLKGKYTLTLNYTDMKLIIEKVAEPFIKGDVNGDGEVDVRDITALIDVIMNSITDNPRADVSEDGDIDVRDITALIDIIMNS